MCELLLECLNHFECVNVLVGLQSPRITRITRINNTCDTRDTWRKQMCECVNA